MSLLLVPYAHLAHLIKKAEMPDVERESLLALAAIVDVDPRVQVVKKLEKHYPGLGRRLDALWSVEGIGSVHLFKVPALKDLGHQTIASRLRKGLDEEPAELDMPDETEADRVVRRRRPVQLRIHGVADEKNIVQTIVRVKRLVALENEDELDFYPSTKDVELRMDLGRDPPLAEVYASAQNAKRCLFKVVSSIIGPFPSRKPKVEQFVALLSFTESDVKLLAKKLGLEQTSGRAHDHSGELGGGEQQVWGPAKKGSRREPLDLTIARLKALNESVNRLRIFNYDYKHSDDGFVEEDEVSFHFEGTPHIRLLRPITRPALDHLVGKLDEVVSAT